MGSEKRGEDLRHHGQPPSPQGLLPVLLFNVAHPRWEIVFQPKYAAYLNLIEPWWKTLKSLAIKGHFFET